ncbi:unnamed protein product [Blepharisma stoltei]|uniref:Glutathione S-transferase n=1 Tax=Blepharisma stoltei TaxID=1481888 RepID=A0AAU9K0F4_9CILI|nr:unnamed protein product [Blepharisma stoltei]
MRLIYQAPDEGVKAILLALKWTGLTVQKRADNAFIVTLQIDAQDNVGNTIEVMGELSIMRYIMEQSPFAGSSNLHLEEWIIYRLKQLASECPKAAIKTNKELIAAVRHLEQSLNGDFIGGSHPGVADFLSFSYLLQFFVGNPWTVKTFPLLAESYAKLSETFGNVLEELGEKAQILKIKKKQENTEPNQNS